MLLLVFGSEDFVQVESLQATIVIEHLQLIRIVFVHHNRHLPVLAIHRWSQTAQRPDISYTNSNNDPPNTHHFLAFLTF